MTQVAGVLRAAPVTLALEGWCCLDVRDSKVLTATQNNIQGDKDSPDWAWLAERSSTKSK